MAINITTPVGRLVGGSPYVLTENKDERGNVKIGKDGKPSLSMWIHVAVPKEAGHTHWAQTEWGVKIWNEGHRAHPNFAPHPGFSWKIEDGDDTTPVLKRKGRRNCDNEFIKNCWLLKLSSTFLPRVFNSDGSVELSTPGLVKLGYFVQVNIDVLGNTGQTPGVYLNPKMLALSYEGDEISYGVDASEAGFGGTKAPAGARPVTPTPAATVGFGAPAFTPPASVTPAFSVPTFAPPAAVAPPPNPAFLAVPVAPSAPVHQMLPAANGASYEAMLAAGWNDALLVAHKMMAG